MKTLEMLHMEEKIFCYQLLWHYYRGDLLNRSAYEWQEIVKLLKEQTDALQNEDIKKALHLLQEMKDEDLNEFPFHYNRLFVGPQHLLASPFESSYRNFEQSIMQQETMLVRNFYHFGGLQVAVEGQFPDDHLQYELEFILHLLGSEDEEQQSVYKLFLEKHLLQWSEKHCEQVFSNSTNTITVAFAYLFKGLLQFEKSMIKGGESLC